MVYGKQLEVKQKMFFFFKQKTAYEIQYGLVGSEMCIRDSDGEQDEWFGNRPSTEVLCHGMPTRLVQIDSYLACLLYTSDAADDLLCVDLGGRRIIKKKNATTAYEII